MSAGPAAAAATSMLPRGAYIALPPRGRPLVIASRDAGVLRYVAANVLSVPPGTGPVLSALLTLGLGASRILAPRRAGARHARDAVWPAIAPTLTSFTSFVSEAGGRLVCLALSKDPNAKLTVLLFPRGGSRPAYVAKVPVTDAAARSVEREAARLADLEAFGHSVPRLVGRVEHLGRPVLVTTAMPGRSMLSAYHAWHHTARPGLVAADFAAAGGWLAGLHHATTSGAVPLGESLDGLTRTIRRRFGDRPGTDAALARLAALRERLASVAVPSSVVHGDFWPGNLLLSDGQVRGVVDWELARPGGPATADVARFVIAYSLYLDRHTRPGSRVPGHPGLRAGRWGSGVEYAMDGSGWYPRLVRSFVRGELERLGVPSSCWRDVLLADLATMAAEADHDEFAWNHLRLFRCLGTR